MPNPKQVGLTKNLNRPVLAENYDNTVMLVPSHKFVASLPYAKIPDRTDFTKMDANQRIKYWRKVLSETERLSDNFNEFLSNNKLSAIKKL